MRTDEWKGMASCPTAAKREDARPVMVWHIFQGAMISDTYHAKDNRFNVYWRDLPREWHNPRVHAPTAADADSLHCLPVIDRQGTLRMAGLHQAQDGNIRLWSACPEPPPDARRLSEEATRRKI